MTIDQSKLQCHRTRRRFLDRDISAVYVLILLIIFEALLLTGISQYLNF